MLTARKLWISPSWGAIDSYLAMLQAQLLHDTAAGIDEVGDDEDDELMDVGGRGVAQLLLRRSSSPRQDNLYVSI